MWGFPKESRIRDDKNLAMFVAFNPLTALNMRTILFSKTVCLSRAKALWISEVEIRKKAAQMMNTRVRITMRYTLPKMNYYVYFQLQSKLFSGLLFTDLH